MKAKEFFAQEWGTGFTKAKLSEKNGLLEMSMEDIYSTMELYAVSQRYTIEDIERCVENWGLCKVEKEHIEKFLNGG
tara:strand:- start:10815 stop:11045 length:231 start_codon:yes stop_codon:yes gene_type:complete